MWLYFARKEHCSTHLVLIRGEIEIKVSFQVPDTTGHWFSDRLSVPGPDLEDQRLPRYFFVEKILFRSRI